MKVKSNTGRREPGYDAADYSLTVPAKSFGVKKKGLRKKGRMRAMRKVSR